MNWEILESSLPVDISEDELETNGLDATDISEDKEEKEDEDDQIVVVDVVDAGSAWDFPVNGHRPAGILGGNGHPRPAAAARGPPGTKCYHRRSARRAI